MTDWRIKYYATLCYNLQNKLTPYKVNEAELKRTAKQIKKEKKCDEVTAWKTLKVRLANAVIKKAAENHDLNVSE